MKTKFTGIVIAMCIAALSLTGLFLTGCDTPTDSGQTQDWGAWTLTTAPSCIAEGLATRVSANSSRTETSPIPIDPNAHKWGEWDIEIVATCTEAGKRTRTCTLCDKSETNIIPALGHYWGVWETTTAATETTDGEEKRTCIHDAAHIEIRSIPATGGTTTTVTGVNLVRTLTFLIFNGNYSETKTLIPTISPANTVSRTVTWASSDEAVATIDNDGVITAHANGTTTITVTTAVGNFTADCDVTVQDFDIDMIKINPGNFQMGSPDAEKGRTIIETQHKVTLTAGFSMGKYPVTQGEYEGIMGTNPSFFTTSVDGDDPGNRPAEMVSWYDALVFCNKLSMAQGLTPAYRISGNTDPDDWGEVPTHNDAVWNTVEIIADSTGYRLPTEAQWEYACRAGKTKAFNWDTDFIDDEKANYDSNTIDDTNPLAGANLQRTTEVGSYNTPNSWGLYDMHGNVREWCWDWFGTYAAGEQTDPEGAVSGNRRIVRGGSWNNLGRHLRSAYRESSNSPSSRYNYIGIRLVLPDND